VQGDNATQVAQGSGVLKPGADHRVPIVLRGSMLVQWKFMLGRGASTVHFLIQGTDWPPRTFLAKQRYVCGPDSFSGHCVGQVQLPAGNYHLVWDNSVSWFKKKPISYEVYTSQDDTGRWRPAAANADADAAKRSMRGGFATSDLESERARLRTEGWTEEDIDNRLGTGTTVTKPTGAPPPPPGQMEAEPALAAPTAAAQSSSRPPPPTTGFSSRPPPPTTGFAQ
jgi:hypothetical protein